MQMSEKLQHSKPNGMADAEWAARLELAAAYRVFHFLGWTELIFNHITLRVPGPECHYLINPFGLNYEEVTASNLVKVALDGQIIGDSRWGINRAGFVIHSAIHAHREDAHCVMHTHTTTGIAVACKRDGLRGDNFYSAIVVNDLAYHDFEGITVHEDEQPRLVASLGAHHAMILRNHGLLSVGASVATAFRRLWQLQRACDVQVMSDSMAGESIVLTREIQQASGRATMSVGPATGMEQMMFDSILRRAGIALDDLV
jgi:ribulose-5-phosphate 4-epimerase/fuculose-1-phosphate aldolase